MAKQYYEVSYKTYFNDRLKRVLFHGVETYPLYIQVTYDRRTSFFKSYYFDVLGQSKYDFARTSLAQVEVLERGLIEHIIARNRDFFGLDILHSKYKIEGMDILDRLERPFKIWLASCFIEEKLPGLAALLEHEPEAVAAIRIWDDLKKGLHPDVFNRIGKKMVRYGPPYILLATYVRNKRPNGPFCLPWHEWAIEEERIGIENFLDDTFSRVDMGEIIRVVNRLYSVRPI